MTACAPEHRAKGSFLVSIRLFPFSLDSLFRRFSSSPHPSPTPDTKSVKPRTEKGATGTKYLFCSDFFVPSLFCSLSVHKKVLI